MTRTWSGNFAVWEMSLTPVGSFQVWWRFYDRIMELSSGRRPGRRFHWAISSIRRGRSRELRRRGRGRHCRLLGCRIVGTGPVLVKPIIAKHAHGNRGATTLWADCCCRRAAQSAAKMSPTWRSPTGPSEGVRWLAVSGIFGSLIDTDFTCSS